MTEIEPNEYVYTCNDCGRIGQVHGGPVTHCEEPDCLSENIDIVADLITRRAKWMWDGSESIDDMIEKTATKLNELRTLKENGWDVNPINSPVTDDYAYLIKYRDDYTEDDLK